MKNSVNEKNRCMNHHNSLLTYLNKRLNSPDYIPLPDKPPGPVITISREVGCSGLELAYSLAARLESAYPGDRWRVLSKEIFRQSAEELNMHPEKVAKIFKSPDKSTFEELLIAFNEKRYKTDQKIKKTVLDIIRSSAEDGFCIIVGRASNIVAGDILNALHVRLTAPLPWRITSIMTKNGWDRPKSVEFIDTVEKERIAYRQAAMVRTAQGPELFDITFDRSRIPLETIVELIMLAIEKQGILDDFHRQHPHKTIYHARK